MSKAPHRFTYASAQRYEEFIDQYVSSLDAELHVKPFDQTLETFASKFRDAMTGLFHGHWKSELIAMEPFRELFPNTVVAIRNGVILVTTKERYKTIRKEKETLHHIEAKVTNKDTVLSVSDISIETLRAIAHLHHERILLKPSLIVNPPGGYVETLMEYDVAFDVTEPNTITIF